MGLFPFRHIVPSGHVYPGQCVVVFVHVCSSSSARSTAAVTLKSAPKSGITSRQNTAFSFSAWSSHVVSPTTVKHLFLSAPMNTSKPKMPKMMKKNTVSSMTLAIIGTDRIIVPISTRMPGNIDSVRSGLRTRITRKAETLLPKPGMLLSRLTTTTEKSMTFQPSFKYDESSNKNPIAITFTTHSSVKTTVNRISVSSITALPPASDGAPSHPRPSIFSGSIWHRMMAFARIAIRMKLSNMGISDTRMQNTRTGLSSSKYPSDRSA